MTTTTFLPPFSPAQDADAILRQRGYALLSPEGVSDWTGCSTAQLQALATGWDDLPPDEYLKDGGRYRRRRHSCFTVDAGQVQPVPHRAHWQPVQYNALHGGMQRWFAPMLANTVHQPAWSALLAALARSSDALFAQPDLPNGHPRWCVEAHQFRIDTTDGIGRPTPEGAHRDGVDLGAVFLIAREGIKGGETRVFESAGPNGQRFTLTEPWSVLLLDDARVVHESTPILPLQQGGHRDTLVVTCRRNSFQREGVQNLA